MPPICPYVCPCMGLISVVHRGRAALSLRTPCPCSSPWASRRPSPSRARTWTSTGWDWGQNAPFPLELHSQHVSQQHVSLYMVYWFTIWYLNTLNTLSSQHTIWHGSNWCLLQDTHSHLNTLSSQHTKHTLISTHSHLNTLNTLSSKHTLFSTHYLAWALLVLTAG